MPRPATLPSFSLVLTTAGVVDVQDARNLLTLEDSANTAVSRTVRFNLPSSSQHNNDLMRTVDTRFDGEFKYEVVYSTKEREPEDEERRIDAPAGRDSFASGEYCPTVSSISVTSTEEEVRSDPSAHGHAARGGPHRAFTLASTFFSWLRRFGLKVLRSFWNKMRRVLKDLFSKRVQAHEAIALVQLPGGNTRRL